jgi:hypothetical protein
MTEFTVRGLKGMKSVLDMPVMQVRALPTPPTTRAEHFPATPNRVSPSSETLFGCATLSISGGSLGGLRSIVESLPLTIPHRDSVSHAPFPP